MNTRTQQDSSQQNNGLDRESNHEARGVEISTQSMRMKIGTFVAAIATAGMLSTASQATIILDPLAQHTNENNYLSFNTNAFVGQYITTTNPYIASVDVRIFNGTMGDTTTLGIYGSDTDNGDPGAVMLTLLGSNTVVFTTNDNTVSSRYSFEDVGGVDVSAYQSGGHRIFLRFSVSAIGGTGDGAGSGELGSQLFGPYLGYTYTSANAGVSWGFPGSGNQLAFSVRSSDIAIVPEPATTSLLLAGLVLTGLSRRIRQRS